MYDLIMQWILQKLAKLPKGLLNFTPAYMQEVGRIRLVTVPSDVCKLVWRLMSFGFSN